MQKDIPKEILDIVGTSRPIQNTVGMSESEVYIYPEYVLKIQKQKHEAENENAMVAWLKGRIPVPKIVAFFVDEVWAYTLMTRVSGKMLCDEEYMLQPETLIRSVAQGMKMLWQIDVSDCALKASRLEQRLIQARRNVEQGLVDIGNVEPETFGEQGFKNPNELIDWLDRNQPKEDLVLTHGDFCLPNVFMENNQISGFIDLGKMGPADRWQDVAIAIRSLSHNFSGKHHGGRVFYHFEPKMLLDELGIAMNPEKYRYYLLLDELF